MKVATFNVNGIGARLPALLAWLAEARPDLVALQEIKVADARFPRAELEAQGYHVATHGEPGRNGVALLSRMPLAGVERGLPGGSDDRQARWIEAQVGGLRVVGLYAPNGNPAPGPRFDYKIAWMERCLARARALLDLEAPVILAGDFNVCPTDRDVARPEAMAEDALCRPESRAAFRRLLAQGWTDALRARFPQDEVYTFWDYQDGAWARNWGLRIDHLLLSPAAADRMTDAGVDAAVRGGERPSDHVPVWVVLEDS
ncbi:MAG: exodeoxyribonuclease III [Sphingomonadaceae bacterium]|uniref:exodeoxyribonuclease III n=1 Tax=Thermaurantiacus sp. TaxID=2820283 RepID=UPI00298EE8B5|nr:exodeoxyribonuclease III [Thermaurantiacus sp.]MCS6986701.1 exodeoxyribonuclease III [Sphingomonadaceae bacterium]MDW8414036.1 exodeoxyribonuclease III [Thermaurantiacus sp.]